MAANKKDPETIVNNQLEQLQSNSKGLVAKVPFDGLKLNRNLDQLYNILKNKNQVTKPLPEEAKARNIYALTQRGFESSEFAQRILGEKYILNRKREDKEIKKANQFFTALDSKYDISTYLAKYNDYMLYNLTDHAFIKGKDRTMKLGISKIKKKWNDQVQSGAWKKNLPVNYKLTARSRFTSDKTNEEITGKKREYFKHLQNYVYANYIRKERNSQGMSVSNLAHHYISINKDDSDIQELWRIISSHVDAVEKRELYKEEIPGDYAFESLTETSGNYLEDVYANMLMSRTNQSYDRNYEQYGFRQDDLRFISQEYLSKVDPELVEFENDVPIWGIVYLYFRSGRLAELKKFVKSYDGRLRGDLKDFDNSLHTYFQNNRKIDENFINNYLMGSRGASGDIFKRMLSVILAKHDKVPAEELISNLEDFLWFNLRVCKFQDDEGVDSYDRPRVLTGYGTLIELQKKILDAGASNFDNDGANPFNYIRTLFLVCAYDEALKYMEQFEELQEETVHFAVVLQESGLLNIRKKYEETEGAGFELLKGSEYHRIILDYIGTFCKNNFIEALYYLKLILSSVNEPCSPELIKKTLSGIVIKNNQISKLFIEDRKKAYEIKEILTAPIYNELIKQISQHSKEPGVIFKLFESVKDYEGIFRLILEEEFKTYEKSKNEEIRNDPKVMAEIAFKFKFLEDSLKNYRFNSQMTTAKIFEVIDFVKATREIFNCFANKKKEFEKGFNIIKKLDEEKKIFGTDERKMQSEYLNKENIEKACYFDILLYGSKIIKGYKDMVSTIQNAEERKDKSQKAVFYAGRLKNYYNKVSPAFDLAKRDVLEALKKEIEHSE